MHSRYRQTNRILAHELQFHEFSIAILCFQRTKSHRNDRICVGAITIHRWIENLCLWNTKIFHCNSHVTHRWHLVSLSMLMFRCSFGFVYNSANSVDVVSSVCAEKAYTYMKQRRLRRTTIKTNFIRKFQNPLARRQLTSLVSNKHFSGRRSDQPVSLKHKIAFCEPRHFHFFSVRQKQRE